MHEEGCCVGGETGCRRYGSRSEPFSTRRFKRAADGRCEVAGFTVSFGTDGVVVCFAICTHSCCSNECPSGEFTGCVTRDDCLCVAVRLQSSASASVTRQKCSGCECYGLDGRGLEWHGLEGHGLECHDLECHQHSWFEAPQWDCSAWNAI